MWAACATLCLSLALQSPLQNPPEKIMMKKMSATTTGCAASCLRMPCKHWAVQPVAGVRWRQRRRRQGRNSSGGRVCCFGRPFSKVVGSRKRGRGLQALQGPRPGQLPEATAITPSTVGTCLYRKLPARNRGSSSSPGPPCNSAPTWRSPRAWRPAEGRGATVSPQCTLSAGDLGFRAAKNSGLPPWLLPRLCRRG